jgi:hypothetical protein
VGTYAYLTKNSGSVYAEGSSHSGSSLYYSGVSPENISNSYGVNYHWPQTRGTVGGTWRAMGGASAMWSGRILATLFIRIS